MNIDHDDIFKQCLNEVNHILSPDDYILEASQMRAPSLKKIDMNFSELQKDLRNSQAKKDLVKNIKDFTKIKSVVVTIKKDHDNACVIPVYNRSLPISMNLWTKVKSIFSREKKFEEIKNVEESAKYIEKIYIFIGDKLINSLANRGLTSIVLHELGHTFAHTSNFPNIIEKWVRILSTVGLVKTLFVGSIIPGTGLSVPISITLLVVSRSLTFVEHLGEYSADKYAAKYGYGDEIIRVLNRFQQEEDISNRQKNFLKKLYDAIVRLFFPRTHPKDSKRICKVAEEMRSKYKKMYPKMSNELTTILNDLKCG